VRSAVTPLTVAEPTSLGAALRLMEDGNVTPLAGCTDLYVLLNFGTLRETRFLDLSRLRSLRRIESRGEMLSIGAMATYREIIASRLVRRRLPILADASREIGGLQIQARGTIGGNIANASPAGDTLPVLAVAAAVVVLASSSGERRVPFTSFYTGYRQTVRRPEELIIAVEIPPLEGAQWFRKVGTRAAQAISRLVMAGIRGPEPRLALGSVGPTVVRLPRTEASLASGAPITEVQGVLASEIHPIDDARATAAYRSRVAQNLLARFWADTSR
jgi:CO/xanthine dehydrogenase FAD-binding subunit